MDINIDPYKILQLNRDADLQQIKEAYRKIALIHHPDKGGDPEKFKILKLAFKMILNSNKTGKPIRNAPSNFLNLRDQSRADPPTNGQNNPPPKFNLNMFNTDFISQKQESEDGYNIKVGIDESNFKERNKAEYERERARVESEIDQVKPIFGNAKEFNNNAFQRMFEHINGDAESRNKALDVYEEPQAMVSGLQAFTEINEDHQVKDTSNLSSLKFSRLDQGFSGQKNPHKINKKLLNKFAKQQDITDVNQIEDGAFAKMKNKMNQYRNTQFNFHQKPTSSTIPSELQAVNPMGSSGNSKKVLDNDFQRKLQERNNLNMKIKTQFVPTAQNYNVGAQQVRGGFNDQPQMSTSGGHRALPIMDYPQNSGHGTFQDSGNDGHAGHAGHAGQHVPPQIMDYPKNSGQGAQFGNQTGLGINHVNQAHYNNQVNQQFLQQQVLQQQQQQQFIQQLMNIQAQSNVQKQLQDMKKTIQKQNRIINSMSKNKKRIRTNKIN